MNASFSSDISLCVSVHLIEFASFDLCPLLLPFPPTVTGAHYHSFLFKAYNSITVISIIHNIISSVISGCPRDTPRGTESICSRFFLISLDCMHQLPAVSEPLAPVATQAISPPNLTSKSFYLLPLTIVNR